MFGLLSSLASWIRDFGAQYFDAVSGTIKGALLWLIAPGIRSIFTFTGLALTTYAAVIQPLADAARDAFTGVPGGLMAWILFFQVDKVVTVLISAYVTSSLAGYLRVVRRVAQEP